MGQQPDSWLCTMTTPPTSSEPTRATLSSGNGPILKCSETTGRYSPVRAFRVVIRTHEMVGVRRRFQAEMTEGSAVEREYRLDSFPVTAWLISCLLDALGRRTVAT